MSGRNQAAFAREHQVPGGASMVTQHITGHRPVSVDAAMAYAKGFGVSLADVSPTAAARVAEAAALLAPTPTPTPAPAAAPDLAAALPVVLSALAGLPPARAASVRAQLELLMRHPEMRDDVLGELQALLQTQPGKHQAAA